MRKTVVFFISILLSHAASAQVNTAPSFDCHKTSLPIEKLICSDSKLSALDAELAKTFAEAKKANPKERNFLIKSQRKWLKERIMCSYNGKNEIPAADTRPHYVECLKQAYAGRIKVLSYPEFWPPLRDSNVEKAIVRLRNMDAKELYEITTDENRDTLSELSCKFFEKDHVAAKNLFSPYFGSFRDTFIPLCGRIDVANLVPEVGALLTALEPIWGGSTRCSGSEQYVYNRREMIIRILAAVDTDPEPIPLM